MKTKEEILKDKRVPSAMEGEFTKYVTYDDAIIAMEEYAKQFQSDGKVLPTNVSSA